MATSNGNRVPSLNVVTSEGPASSTTATSATSATNALPSAASTSRPAATWPHETVFTAFVATSITARPPVGVSFRKETYTRVPLAPATIAEGAPGNGIVAVSTSDVESTTVTVASSRLERYASGPARTGVTPTTRTTAAIPPSSHRVGLRESRYIGS